MILPLFDEVCTKAYMKVKYPRFSLDEVLDILHYFFEAYERHRGEPHPPLTVGNTIRIIEKLSDDSFIFIDNYTEYIDAYFDTRYRDCDYRINHFLSGRITEILNCRLMCM